MHGRALQREAQLKVENERLQRYLIPASRAATLRRKTETSAATAPAASDAPHADPPPRQPRGQQRGGPSPKRRDYSHLPAVVEDKVLPPDQCHCSRCGQPFADFPGTEDSTILEIDVRAHRRVIRRRRYRPTCSCGAHPGIVTAPPPDRLIPKSMLGISILVTVLLDEYLSTGRPIGSWRTRKPRPGPVVGHPDRRPEADGAAVGAGVRGLGEAEPRAEAVARRRDAVASLRHARREGRLPVVSLGLSFPRGRDLHPGGRAVAKTCLRSIWGRWRGPGIMVVDRYKAYQAVDKVKSGLIVLAFCWAHVRRDPGDAELAGSRSLGDGLGGTDRRIVPTQ